MKRIKFSIIIPIYNMEKYLVEALDSVESQSYPNFEVIMVDDGSVDDSTRLAREYAAKDSRFRLIYHEFNRGVSAARNTGIAEANGDYILFMDPDDTWEPKLLERVENSLFVEPVDLLVFGFHEQYYKAGGALDHAKDVNIAESSVMFLKASEIHEKVMEMEQATMFGYPWNKAYRREIIHEYDISFPEGQNFAEDVMFNADVMDHVASLTILPDYLYNYRNFLRKRLTSGVVDNYFEYQKKRVARLYEQQQHWHTLNDEALEVLAGTYFRSFQSMIMRELQMRTPGMKIYERCKIESKGALYKELSQHVPSAGKASRLLYRPIADGKFGRAIRRGRQINFLKKHFGRLYNRIKR